MENYLNGTASHPALKHKSGFSRILMGMAFVEHQAMALFKIPNEDAWYALAREERARKVAYIQASQIIDAVQGYEAAHKGNK